MAEHQPITPIVYFETQRTVTENTKWETEAKIQAGQKIY